MVWFNTPLFFHSLFLSLSLSLFRSRVFLLDSALRAVQEALSKLRVEKEQLEQINAQLQMELSLRRDRSPALGLSLPPTHIIGNVEQLEHARNEASALLGSKRELEVQLKEERDHSSELQQELSEKQESLRTLERTVTSLQQQLEAVRRATLSEKGVQGEWEALYTQAHKSNEEQTKRVAALLKEREEISRKLSAKEEENAHISAEHVRLSVQLAQATDERAKLIQLLEVKRNQSEKPTAISPSSSSPGPALSVTPSISESVHTQLQQRLAETENQVALLKSELLRAQDSSETARADLTHIREKILPDLNASLTNERDLRASAEKSLTAARAELERQRETELQTLSKRQDMESQISSMRSRIEQMLVKIESFYYSPSLFDLLAFVCSLLSHFLLSSFSHLLFLCYSLPPV